MSDEEQKSCFACPNRLSPEDSIRYFKKSIGAPMCAKFGHVLGRPGATSKAEKILAEYRARNCSSFGEKRVAVPEAYEMQVAVPDPSAPTAPPELQLKVLTCGACANFVRDEIVAPELGWTAGLCSAKGKLLLSTRLRVEAAECELRVPGVNRSDLDGIFLLSEYSEALGNSSVMEGVFQTAPDETDPRTYETDRDVTADDTAQGIRAWRVLEDPATGNQVAMPIYDGAFFSDEERAKIPQIGDDEHPELYIDHLGLVYKLGVLWRELDETPALWGIAGTGKTELYRHAAFLMQLPFERISITGSTELEDLAGKMMYEKDRGTYFQPGRLVKAWAKPSVICLDEPNTGMPDVWQFLRPLTDNSKQLVLDMADGDRIARHEHCYLGLAMNPAWDPRNVGTGTIGDADGSRLMHIETDLPPETVERKILIDRCAIDNFKIGDDVLKPIMRIAKEIRALSEDGTLPVTWGIRHQIKVARLSRWMDLVSAYRMAAADYLEPEAREALLGVVRAHSDGSVSVKPNSWGAGTLGESI